MSITFLVIFDLFTILYEDAGGEPRERKGLMTMENTPKLLENSADAAYAVIGHPLGHSMSPFIHERLFALEGVPQRYGAQDIPPAELARTLPAMLKRMRGINVTIPHKQAVIPLLDRLEGRAELYRSVNTIAVTDTGTVGYNTDADGFLQALEAGGVTLGGRVALLGCGGVGRTFACEAALAGATIVNAVREADQAAADALHEYVRGLVPDVPYEIVRMDELEGAFDLLINATPVGMYPQVDGCPVSETVVNRCGAVFDAVYNPGETRLLRLAKAAGKRAVGGMPMLVWQAVVAHRYWSGASYAPEDIEQLIRDAQREMDARFMR